MKLFPVFAYKYINSVTMMFNRNAFRAEFIFSLVAFFVFSLTVSVAQSQSLDSMFRRLLQPQKMDTSYVNLLNNISYAMGDRDGDMSAQYAQQALSLATKLNDLEGIARAYNNLGLVASQKMENTTSLLDFQKSIDAYRKAQDSLGISNENNNLGLFYSNMGDGDRSLYYSKLYQNYVLRKGKPKDIAIGWLNLGVAFGQVKKNDSALYASYKALPIFQQLNDTMNSAFTLMNIASTFVDLQKYSQAEKLLNYVVPMFKRANDMHDYFYALDALAEVYVNTSRADVAVTMLRPAIEEANTAKSADVLTNLYVTLIEADSTAGNYLDALKNYNIFFSLNDSLKDFDRDKQLAEMETKYSVAEKNRENQFLMAEKQQQDTKIENQQISGLALTLMSIFSLALFVAVYYAYRNKSKLNVELHSLNIQLNRQREELVQKDRMKDKLFSVIAHDLRGPFHSLKTLLDNELYEHLSPEEWMRLMPALKNQVDSTSELFDNMLLWSRSQMKGLRVNLSTFCLYDLIDQLNQQSFAKKIYEKNVIFRNKVDVNLMINSDYELVGIVLRNLLSNAIKFTPAGRSVTIQALQENNIATIHVIDEGIGISGTQVADLFNSRFFSSPGTNQEKGSGVGLYLCKEFIELLGGTISIESELGVGTTFTCVIPSHVKEAVPAEAVLV
jgi:two-component system, sensor histidine kinase and response regulator